VTVAEPAMDADDPSQVAYEELRGFAIAGATSGGLGLVRVLASMVLGSTETEMNA